MGKTDMSDSNCKLFLVYIRYLYYMTLGRDHLESKINDILGKKS